jgi:hypothetical protein
MDKPDMTQNHDPTLQRRPKTEGEGKDRGRRRSRPNNKGKESSGDGSPVGGPETVEGHSSGTDGPSRKRRRSRKGLDKKFECPQEGCGKSYSRAEHLSVFPASSPVLKRLANQPTHSYRHQLNHTPKQIYNCDFQDCQRTFVRQDLCNRHRDRHTAKGSQLHRKDSILGHAHPSPVVENGKSVSAHGSSSPEVMRPNLAGLKSRASQLQYQSPQDMNSNPYSPVTNPSSGTYSGAGSSNGADNFPPSGGFKRSNSDSINRGQDGNLINTPGSRPQRHASFGMADSKAPDFSRPPLQTAVGPYGLLSSASSNAYHGTQPSPQPPYVSQQNFTPFTLPPPGFATSVTAAASSRESDPTYPTSMSTEYPGETSHHQQSGPDMMLLDQMTAPNTMPVFGGEGYSRSPFAIPEDFVAYLFSGQQVDNASPMGPIGQQGYAK